MSEFLKPSNLNNVWASGGDRIYPGDTKYATGWQVEIPPRQYFNEIDYKQDQMLAHLNQHGIPVWDNETEYQADQSYVQGSTGTVYRCVLTHTNQNPDSDVSNTYWIIAFASAGDFYTATESDARYAQITNNGSDYNIATFRNNIQVYSKTETYNKTEVDAKTTVASTTQAQVGTSNTVLMTPLRTEEWGTANVLGIGQTWQNVTASRASGTTYTNTTGKPIMVSVYSQVFTNSRAILSAYVDGLNIQVSLNHTTDTGVASVCFIAPDASTYSVTSTDTPIAMWAELR